MKASLAQVSRVFFSVLKGLVQLAYLLTQFGDFFFAAFFGFSTLSEFSSPLDGFGSPFIAASK
ncbi:hypothetical protein [Methylocucumis oryzae]|uniref:hypothetical protein n=1 Tax=Methylocucumis oryzae TaxID=1632867 RepID=UPI0012FF368F|nr:hypothetical protein [Methylocucumis oryzae]